MPESNAVRVRLFARARDLVGADAVTLDVPAAGTVGDLRRRLADTYPALGKLLEHSALALGDEFAEDSRLLPSGAEVALLPPVSGGGPAPGNAHDLPHHRTD